MTDHDDTNDIPDPPGADDSPDPTTAPPPPPPGAADEPDTSPPPPPPADGQPPRVSLGADGAVSTPGPPPDQGNWFQNLPMRVKIGVPIVIIILIVGFIASRGTTSAEDLKAGDCFEEPSGTEIRNVSNQDCDGLHEAEILTEVNMAPGSAWPGGILAFDAQVAVENSCFDSLSSIEMNDDNIPADAILGYFFTDEGDWDDGNREVLCYVTSVAGLPGRVLVDG